MSTNQRQHSAHPPSAVKHNPAVNAHPNPAPVEKAAMPPPNNNPSLGPIVSFDAVNSRVQAAPEEIEPDDCVDADDPDVCVNDRKKGDTSVY